MGSLKTCYFCGRGPGENAKVVSGKGANICKDCATSFKTLMRTVDEDVIRVTRMCSFCQQYESATNPLLLHTGCRAICRECADKASVLIGAKVV